MLLKIFFTLLFFGNFIEVNGSYADVFCSTTSTIPTNGFKSNDFFYLMSSPTFPESLSNRNYSAPCGIDIAAVDDGNRIWFAMVDGEIGTLELFDGTANQTIQWYNSNTDITTKFTTSSYLQFRIQENNSLLPWTAFTAVALAYDPKLNLACPFSSQVFDFTLIPYVIPIASEFEPDSTYRFKSCNWAFTLNSTQQLKVVIKKLNPSSDFLLTLNIDGKPHIFNHSVNYIYKPYYFDGTNFNLTFTNQWSNSSQSNFFILVSAVKKTTTFTSERCKVPFYNGTNTIFSNMEYVVGYPKNQRCNNSIKIPSNSEAAVYFTENHIEMYSDTLTLNYGNNQVVDIQSLDPFSYYTILPAASGALLIFKSDGNTQQAGYNVVVQTYECKCSPLNDFVISCDGIKTLLPLAAHTGTYCDNMSCTYNVLPNPNCPNKYFYLEIYPLLRATDYLLFKDNGIAIQNYTYNHLRDNAILYSSKAKLSFEFSSGISKNLVTPDAKQWFVQATTNATVPNFQKIDLNDSMPKSVIWLDSMKVNDAIRVCSDDKNLEIYVSNSMVNDLSNYQLYDGDDLFSSVGNLDSKSISSSSTLFPRRKVSSSGCFTLFKTSEPLQVSEATVLFKKGETNAINCNENTIFEPTNYGDNFEVASSASGSCEMIILVSSQDLPRIWLKVLETTPSAAKYTFTDLTTNKELMVLDASETSLWQAFGIYTTALSITVPPSSKISLIAANSPNQAINIETLPQKGIMTSPQYRDSAINNVQLYVLQQYLNDKDNITLNLTVKELTGSPTVELQVDNSPRQQLSLNDHRILTGKTFGIYYSTQNPLSDNFLIEYMIQKADTTQNSSAKNGFGFLMIFTLIFVILS